jgi:hypothetical protein
MHGNLPAEAQRSIFPGVISDAESSLSEFGVRSDSDGSGWFAKLARNLWSPKAPAAVEHLAGTPLSTSQRWCRGGSDITGSALRDLIRSSDGARVLAEIMRGSKQPWWQSHLRAERIVTALDEQFKLDLR